MVVSLGSELFNQKESTVKIDSIFNSFLDRKYILHFDDDEVIENSYWANEARTQYKELLVESFINTLNIISTKHINTAFTSIKNVDY